MRLHPSLKTAKARAERFARVDSRRNATAQRPAFRAAACRYTRVGRDKRCDGYEQKGQHEGQPMTGMRRSHPSWTNLL
jgi:hypothetical protein